MSREAGRVGLAPLSTAVLTYSLSSLLNAASAGLFVLAIESGGLGAPAALLVVGGVLLLGVTIILLVYGISRLRDLAWLEAGTFMAASTTIATFALVTGLLVIGLGTLTVLAKADPRQFGVALLSGAAAVVFLVGLALPAVRFSTYVGRPLALIGGVLGLVGTVGAVSMMLQPRSSTPTFLTLGGYPLVNWNLPFGLIVSLGSFLLWASYQRLSDARARD